MSILTVLLTMVITFLCLLGLGDVFILIWIFWRGDKTDEELPRWYLKFSKWLKKKWDENMDRYERRQVLEWDEDEFRARLKQDLERDVR